MCIVKHINSIHMHVYTSYALCVYTHTHTHTHTHTIGYPITTEAVRYGLRVGVLALPANPKLLTPQAMKFVGPAAFACPRDVQYCPPRSLPEIGKTLRTH